VKILLLNLPFVSLKGLLLRDLVKIMYCLKPVQRKSFLFDFFI
jgi:hypothetical protein